MVECYIIISGLSSSVRLRVAREFLGGSRVVGGLMMRGGGEGGARKMNVMKTNSV